MSGAEGRAAQAAWVDRVLDLNVSGEPLFGSPPDPDLPAKGTVAYRKALLAFGAARTAVQKQLAALSGAISASLPHEAEMAKAVSDRINGLSEEIVDAVDKALNSIGGDRAAANEEARSLVEGYVAQVNGDDLIAHVDDNPFVPVEVRRTLSAALERIAATIV